MNVKNLLIIFFALFVALSLSNGVKAQKKKVTTVKKTAVTAKGNLPVKSKAKTNDSPCSTYIVTTTDKMTDETASYSRNSTLVSSGGNNGFNTLWVTKYDSLILVFDLFENGRKVCIPDFANLIFLFTDGTKMNLIADNQFNCDGRIQKNFGNSERGEAELGNLTTKTIEAVRIPTYKSFIEADFTPLQARKFLAELNCLWEPLKLSSLYKRQKASESKNELNAKTGSNSQNGTYKLDSEIRNQTPEQKLKNSVGKWRMNLFAINGDKVNPFNFFIEQSNNEFTIVLRKADGSSLYSMPVKQEDNKYYFEWTLPMNGGTVTGKFIFDDFTSETKRGTVFAKAESEINYQRYGSFEIIRISE